MDNTKPFEIDESLMKKALASSVAVNEPRYQRIKEDHEDYKNIGQVQHEIRPHFKSTKVYGQYLAKILPETHVWDAPLRRNCLWLYEALYVPGSDGSDLFEVLDIESLTQLKTANPTVIRRKYHNAKDGSWDSSNPKRKRAKMDDSEPEPGARSSMPNKPLPRNLTSNGAAYEAHL